MEFQHTIDFEELQPIIEGCLVDGMMLYGTAVLASADPAEPHMFYVKEATINGANGGLRLSASGAGVMGFPSEFRKRLFKSIADAIENDRSALGRFAQSSFSGAVRDASEPDPDFLRDRKRDDAAYFGDAA